MTPVSAPVVPDPNATFPQFPRLPLEIRRTIWRAALPGPRKLVLQLFCLKDPEYPVVRPRRWNAAYFPGAGAIIGCAPRNSNPAIFHTCRESLEVASETYTLTFGSLGVKPRTWFNYDIDSVYLDISLTPPRLQRFDIDTVIRELTSETTLFATLDQIDGLDSVLEVILIIP